jgi:aminopeptidase N
MAVLSSSSANYLDALSDLARIYLARGYPFALVKKWIKENSAKRWANRFSEKSPSGVTGGSFSSKLLVLKSTFDPAWEEFNVHELEDVVVKQWVNEIAAMRTRWTTFWNSGNQAVVDAFFAGRNTGDDIAEWQTGNHETVNSSEADREGEAADGMTENLWLKFLRKNRQGNGYTVDRYLDVSSLGLTNARWLVSRKKVRGLADILNKLKRDALDESSRLQELHSMAVATLPMDDIPEHSGIHWFADMDVDG